MKEVNVKRGETIVVSTEHATINIQPRELYTRVHIYAKHKARLLLRVDESSIKID